MNKKFKIIILLVTLLISTDGNTQTNENKKNLIYIDVAPIIMPPNRISLGYLYNFESNYFVGIELGHSVDKSNGRENGNASDYKLFMYRLQLGYNFNPNKKFQNYISIDFQQINHSETLYDDYFRSTNKNEGGYLIYYSYDKIDFKREKITANFNYGFFAHFNSKKTFGINPSIGLGIKIVDVKFKNPTNLKEDYHILNSWGTLSRYRKEGKEIGINMNFQLKFFYKF